MLHADEKSHFSSSSTSILQRLTVEIPVNTTDPSEFMGSTTSDGIPIFRYVSRKIGDFIDDNIVPIGFAEGKTLYPNLIAELIKNSYDAFIDNGLVVNQNLILKIVIKINEKNELVLKFKDNGPGFPDKAPGEIFSTYVCVDKKKDGAGKRFGGQKAGLSGIARYIADAKANMQIKNRVRIFGCAFNFTFPIPSLTQRKRPYEPNDPIDKKASGVKFTLEKR